MEAGPAILGIIGIVGIGFVIMLGCIAGIARWLKPREDSFDDLTDWPGVASGQFESLPASAPGIASGGGILGAVPSGEFSRSLHGEDHR
jgi:hypothetical protein